MVCAATTARALASRPRLEQHRELRLSSLTSALAAAQQTDGAINGARFACFFQLISSSLARDAPNFTASPRELILMSETTGFCPASTRVVLLLILLVEGSRAGAVLARDSRLRSSPDEETSCHTKTKETPSGAELSVSAAISSHATSQTHRRRRLSSRVTSGSNKKKARGSPGELAPATASSTALRCIYL